jgi:predicted glutamine amidotransferase
MCRLLGVLSAEDIDHDSLLLRSTRSLATLSVEHPHGWGVAVRERTGDWSVHRSISRAGDDPLFHDVATNARSRTLVAHVRRRTVGALSLENTHPFRRGRWVFAHNGTIPEAQTLTRRISARRRREIEGETDSELLFALLLTVIDDVGATEGVQCAPTRVVDAALVKAMAEVTARSGAATFLCSDGDVLYAFRHGRTLHVLERAASAHEAAAVLVSSEPLTDEPWRAVAEGTLLRVDGGREPRWCTAASADTSAG